MAGSAQRTSMPLSDELDPNRTRLRVLLLKTRPWGLRACFSSLARRSNKPWAAGSGAPPIEKGDDMIKKAPVWDLVGNAAHTRQAFACHLASPRVRVLGSRTADLITHRKGQQDEFDFRA